jgi:phenylacetate-CoA ligase
LTLLSTSKSIIEEDGNVKEFVIVQTNSPFWNWICKWYRIKFMEIEKIENAIALYLEPGLHFVYSRKPG